MHSVWSRVNKLYRSCDFKRYQLLVPVRSSKPGHLFGVKGIIENPCNTLLNSRDFRGEPTPQSERENPRPGYHMMEEIQTIKERQCNYQISSNRLGVMYLCTCTIHMYLGMATCADRDIPNQLRYLANSCVKKADLPCVHICTMHVVWRRNETGKVASVLWSSPLT